MNKREEWYLTINGLTGDYKVLTIVEVEAMLKTIFSNSEELLKRIKSLDRGESDRFDTSFGGFFTIERMEVQ